MSRAISITAINTPVSGPLHLQTIMWTGVAADGDACLLVDPVNGNVFFEAARGGATGAHRTYSPAGGLDAPNGIVATTLGSGTITVVVTS